MKHTMQIRNPNEMNTEGSLRNMKRTKKNPTNI